MVGSSMYSHHVTLDTYDTVNQSDFDVLSIQNRSLLNMGLKEVSNGSVRPFCVLDLLRIQSVTFHCVINGNAIGIFKFLTVLYIPVSEHCSGSEVAGTETHSLFIAESDNSKVSLWLDAFFL